MQEIQLVFMHRFHHLNIYMCMYGCANDYLSPFSFSFFNFQRSMLPERAYASCRDLNFYYALFFFFKLLDTEMQE